MGPTPHEELSAKMAERQVVGSQISLPAHLLSQRRRLLRPRVVFHVSSDLAQVEPVGNDRAGRLDRTFPYQLFNQTDRLVIPTSASIRGDLLNRPDTQIESIEARRPGYNWKAISVEDNLRVDGRSEH
jgi:hypothetical protein